MKHKHVIRGALNSGASPWWEKMKLPPVTSAYFTPTIKLQLGTI